MYYYNLIKVVSGKKKQHMKIQFLSVKTYELT
jgi:hypothetical protein